VSLAFDVALALERVQVIVHAVRGADPEVAADLLFIFVLRAIDVGMGTVRIVLLSRGRKGTATIIGFFEALVWVVAVSRVLAAWRIRRMVAFMQIRRRNLCGSMVEEWLAIAKAPFAGDDEWLSAVAPAIRQKGFGARCQRRWDEREVQVTTVVPRRSVSDVEARPRGQPTPSVIAR
jgi:uncharacterized protein YebE (UPF0316 family)